MINDEVSGGHDAELRQVTAVFSDLTGFTSMSERLDPEDVRDVTEQVFAAAAAIVQNYGGRIDKLMGDGILAIFGDPVSHEDDAERAVRATLDLHRAVDALGPVLEPRTGCAVQLHSGINTGVVVIGGRQLDQPSAGPLGDAINLASRLQGLAAPGEILLGESTSRLVLGIFDLEDLGEHDVKGKALPVAVSRVRGIATERTPPSRRRASFVGRHEELGALLAAVERLRDHDGGVITVIGDAGAGKTRLLAEVRERAGDDLQWLEGRAYAYGERNPYAPVIDLISRAVGIEEGDSPEKVRRRLDDAVGGLLGDDGMGFVGPLLRLYAVETEVEAAVDREAFQGRLLHSTQLLVEALAARAPTVVYLQDLHWADAPSIALVCRLVEHVRVPVLFVFNARPGFELGAPGERTVQVSELSARQTAQLVASLLETSAPPASLVTLVEARTDGNPFFVEEIVNSLIESGLLVRVDGTWTVTGRLDEASVPPTIRGVIAARIDRLDHTRRRILQEASVVGREFLYRIVNEVTTSGSELAASLTLLEGADLIREGGSDPDLEYFFKHALTQEVAYGGLLKRERQQLHERVARAIETQLGHRLGELTEVLAHHWVRAGIVDQAVHYLRLAGRKAVERYAVDEADHFYDEAYRLLADTNRSETQDALLCGTLVEWMVVHYYRSDFTRITALLEQHEPDFDRLGDPELSGMALAWRGNAESVLVHLDRSFDLLERATAIGERDGNVTVLAHAITWKLWTLFFSGRFQDVLDEARRLPPLIAALEDDRYVMLKSHAVIAWANGVLGRVDEAVRLADELIELGERTSSARALSLGHSIQCSVGMFSADWDPAIAEGTEAVRAVQDPVYRAIASATLVSVLASAGRTEPLRRQLDFAPESDDIITEIHRWAEGLCLVLEGHLSHGMDVLERARQRAQDAGFGWGVAVTDVFIATTYARIATREATAELSAVLRNPRFVLRHAAPARRKARQALDRVRVEHLEGKGMEGLRFNYEFELAKFLIAERDVAGAIEAARRALAVTEASGDTEGRRQVAALLRDAEART